MADPNAHHTDEHPVHLDTDDARGGEATGAMRYVLSASLVLVVIAFLAVYFLH